MGDRRWHGTSASRLSCCHTHPPWLALLMPETQLLRCHAGPTRHTRRRQTAPHFLVLEPRRVDPGSQREGALGDGDIVRPQPWCQKPACKTIAVFTPKFVRLPSGCCTPSHLKACVENVSEASCCNPASHLCPRAATPVCLSLGACPCPEDTAPISSLSDSWTNARAQRSVPRCTGMCHAIPLSD
ncbi:hypothetical protein GQ54DRAFT_66858 [Martensiomyces pterosporus]|nr:hypothetical protein GQ54DRAFT_66858 [Martensiomyces pterosporus]